MSSANDHLITRREVLQALAALPFVALPALPEPAQESPTVEAPANTEAPNVIEDHYKQLMDHVVTIMDFQGHLLGVSRFGYQVDAAEFIEKWAAASLAAKAIDDMLISVLFEAEVLKPLCGPDYHRFIAALAYGVEKAQG